MLRPVRVGGYSASTPVGPARKTIAVEFLDYKEYVGELRAGHVVASDEGDLVRFRVDASGKGGAQVHALLFAPVSFKKAPDDGATHIATPADSLPQRLDALIHAARLSEVAVVPAGLWRTVMDLVAYELATDESWLDVDTEASLHLNTRDPLLLTPPDLHILRTLAGALLNAVQSAGGGEPAQDLSIVTPGSALVFELDHRGAIRVQCANATLAEHLAEAQ